MINAKAVATIDEFVTSAAPTTAPPCDRWWRRRRPGPLLSADGARQRAPATRSPAHEIFGPVAPVITFDDTDAGDRQANDTEMGLTGYVYTRTSPRAWRSANGSRPA
jgi:succinate-semialdehyde dehydrogenase / glutarate-semialdehyde dehydrogenase